MLLKKGAAAGLTLFDIAKIIARQDLEQRVPSELEGICEQANGDFLFLFVCTFQLWWLESRLKPVFIRR